MSPGLRHFARRQNRIINGMTRRLCGRGTDREVEALDEDTNSEGEEDGGDREDEEELLSRAAAETLETGRPSGFQAAAADAEATHGSAPLGARCCFCFRCTPKRVINVSFVANVVLMLLKVYAAAWSGSLAILGSAIDSVLDICNACIIFCTARAAARNMPHKYPAGRSRLEPVSVVVFAAVMATAALTLLREAIGGFVSGLSNAPERNLDPIVLGVVGSTVVVKLALFFAARSQAEVSSTVAALGQDHFNDTVTNAMTLGVILVVRYVPTIWWLDPLAAVLLAIYIFQDWLTTGLEQTRLLVGRAASPGVISQLVRMALTHHPSIEYVDTVRAYHHGARLMVEIDVVLPVNMPLWRAHDIGESLQVAVERLAVVERCFVHLDSDATHDVRHEHVVKRAVMLEASDPAAAPASPAPSPSSSRTGSRLASPTSPEGAGAPRSGAAHAAAATAAAAADAAGDSVDPAGEGAV